MKIQATAIVEAMQKWFPKELEITYLRLVKELYELGATADLDGTAESISGVDVEDPGIIDGHRFVDHQ